MDQHLIAIILLWIVLGIFVLCIFVRWLCKKRVEPQQVIQKGITPTEIVKEDLRVQMVFIFKSPENGFKINSTSITMDIITFTKQEPQRVKFITFKFNCSTMEKTCGRCYGVEYRHIVDYIRRKRLPPITHVRAIHNGKEDATIFLEGMEVINQRNGERTFYELQEKVVYMASKEKRETLILVKPLKLTFWSLDTFCPNFYSLSFERFGNRSSDPNDKLGIQVKPKLEWLEIWVLFTFLTNITFCLTKLCFKFDSLMDFGNKLVFLLVIVPVSCFVSFAVTELIACLHKYFKGNYLKKCSPMQEILKQSSLSWKIIYFSSWFSILVISIVFTAIAYFKTSKDRNIKQILNTELDEYALLLFLWGYLFISLIFWHIIFCLFRFLYRCSTFTERKDIDIEKNDGPDVTEATDTSTPSTTSDKIVERKERGETLEEIKQVTGKQTTPPKSAVKGKSPRKKKKYSISEKTESISQRLQKTSKTSKDPKKLTFNTERLDKESADKEKRNKLLTNSVIPNPSQSKGYLNPEDFRLSDSKLNNEKIKQKKT